MSGDTRPASAYIHGVSAIVSARFAAWLEKRARLEEIRHEGGLDPEIYAGMTAIHYAATVWRNQMSGSGRDRAPDPDTSRRLIGDATLSTRVAASLLGIEQRSVVRLIGGGSLPATKLDGRWRIDREALTELMKQRKTR